MYKLNMLLWTHTFTYREQWLNVFQWEFTILVITMSKHVTGNISVHMYTSISTDRIDFLNELMLNNFEFTMHLVYCCIFV